MRLVLLPLPEERRKRGERKKKGRTIVRPDDKAAGGRSPPTEA
jgi:hypothetical protein